MLRFFSSTVPDPLDLNKLWFGVQLNETNQCGVDLTLAVTLKGQKCQETARPQLLAKELGIFGLVCWLLLLQMTLHPLFQKKLIMLRN